MTEFIELETFYKKINNLPSDTVRNEIGQFNIFRIEDILLPKNKEVSYSKRSFFKISIITGHNKIHYADQCVEILESAMVFTNPMVPYSWEIISEKQTGYVCVFTESFFNRFGNIREYPVFQSADTAIIPITLAETPKYTLLFSRMFEELQSDYVYKYDLIRNLLMEVIHAGQKIKPALGSPSTGSNASERISGLFTELLERQFPIELSSQTILLNSPSDFARQLNLHVNHLNKSLKEITGQTTSQLINDRKLQEAKILLRSTNWTINEIAWSLGFEEPNHFSSFFKSRSKTTPKKFRTSN